MDRGYPQRLSENSEYRSLYAGPPLDSRFRGNDLSRLNATQGEFSDSFSAAQWSAMGIGERHGC